MNEEFKTAISEALKGLDTRFQTTEQVKAAIEEALVAKFETVASKEDIKKAIEDFSKIATEDFKEMIETQKGTTKKAFSIGEISLKDFDHKAFLGAGKSGQYGVVLTKAAGSIVTANASGHATTYEVEGEINSAPHEPNVLLQALIKGNTDSRTIFWVNRKKRRWGCFHIRRSIETFEGLGIYRRKQRC